jgi:nucleoside-diphosphate-sugar epimerase
VTGGTGFIGSHTVEHLLQKGFSVRCLVRRFREGLGWLEGLPVDVKRVSLFDVDALKEAARDAEYIFHVAGVTKARRHREFFEGNVTTTRNLLEAASGSPRLKKFCLISSLTAVGPSPDGTPLDESAPARPVTSYGISKLQAETLCQLHSKNIPIVIIRPPAVYGPRDRDVLELFHWLKRGIKPILGDPRKTVSIIYATDLAQAIVGAAVSEKTTGETYFVSDGAVYRYSDIIERLAKMIGRRTFTLRAPAPLVYAVAGLTELLSAFSSKPPLLNLDKARDLIQPHWVCNPRKIEEHIGFKSSVSHTEGLQRTFEWYKEYGWI